MAGDSYRTLRAAAEGHYAEKRSRFLSFAIPVCSAAEAKERIDAFRKRYHDARHVCWAYMLGAERENFRSSDDGEPSSTAGRPILGQINSRELTDVLVIVVRYFGGTELGTGGLTAAYRTAAAEALAAAETEERTVDEDVTAVFDYPYLNGVMRVIREMHPRILSQQFEMTCEMTLRIRRGDAEALKNRLLKVETVRLKR
ncbi:MAG: YigZ family protein [Tannerella sp.]|jgi:uncharacterized YigZ family protein|nr:YigZ family protein [Tannerella sp.]